MTKKAGGGVIRAGMTATSCIGSSPGRDYESSNVQMVTKETRAAAAAPVPIPEHVATSTEQAMLARIESMERELQALRAMTRAAGCPSPPSGARLCTPRLGRNWED